MKAMINASIRKLKQDASAKLIIVSYSPTGGGHTARLLNIITLALEKKSIPEDSIVIFHVPCPWEGTPRSPLVASLARKLVSQKIHVWIAESDKSIYGYLNKDTGGSDDANILQRVTHFPLRNQQNKINTSEKKQKIITNLNECVYFKNDTSENELPVISAKDLMSGVLAEFGHTVIAERTYLLTDMDPYLQKAASSAGVPGKRCLDQQNHAILLNLNDTQLNLLPKYALLSKVLGGYGEKISHIDLGGCNTLNSLCEIATRLNIYSGTPKYISRIKIADLLLTFALSKEQIDTRLNESDKPFAGVICGSGVKHGGDARNIIYVYAHKKTNIIARCVNERMLAGDPAFCELIFLFCGAGAVGNLNAMHLAYLADADGITTAGAGTVGEYAYLRKKAGCSSRLLILPIEGHNEQEKNADVISQDNVIKAFVVRTLQSEQLSDSLQRFVSGASRSREAPQTMNEFITAISNPNTYVQQAYDLLFSDASTVNFSNIQQVEQLMNQNPLLRATRKYLKLVFQSLSATNGKNSLSVSFQQGSTHTFANVKELSRTLQNPASLAQIIGLKSPGQAAEMPLLREVRQYFSGLANGDSPPAGAVAKLKEEFGEFMVTGF